MQLANIRKIYDREKNENNATIKAFLSSEDTKLLLHAAPQAYKTQINDILLTALMLAYGDLTGEYTLYFDLEGHGREHITENLDLSQTVGWFTSVFPVFLSLENVDDLSTVIKYVKEQLRQIPAHGIGFGILRFLSKEKNNFDSIREPDIIFNYLGQLDNTVIKGRLLKNAVESYGSCSHPKNKHSYSLEISAQIKNGIFEISWTCVDTYDPKILEVLASQYIDRLKSLISHCTNMDNFGYVPSDFPLAKLNQQTLDKVFGRIKKIEDIYPLSPLQAGLLFTALADIQSDTYLVQTLYTFKGNVDTEILRLACQTINEHYSAFRTGFVWEGLDSPLQFIQKESNLIWKLEDWNHLSSEEHSLELKKLLESDRQLKFDFNHPPLSRWRYIKVSEHKGYLLWTHHHILLDGWSGPIILSQLISAYQQLFHNSKPHLLYSPSYKDYIRYLEQHTDAYEEFWTNYLKDIKSSNYLHNKLSLRDNTDKTHDYYEVKFSLRDTDKIKACAKNLQVTLNTLIQGAWALLLSLFTQNEDVVFGVTVSGRNINLEGVEEIVGLFINTLPLRVQVKKDQTLKEFLASLQLNMAQINSRAHSSLAKIKSYAQAQDHKDLFNNILIFENFPTDQKFTYSPMDFQLEKTEAFEKTEYPLSLTVNVVETLSFNIRFETAFFDQEGINKLASYFINIINRIQNNESEKLQDLLDLTQEDKTQLLKDWNDTECEFQSNETLPLLYDTTAERYANKVAVRYLDQNITYAELNQKANQLAHYLAKTGLVYKRPVGICLERSIDLIVAMLAILKAGGHYIPLDPSHPQERLQYMLKDAEVKILITASQLAGQFPHFDGSIANLDELKDIFVNEQITPPLNSINAEDLAYIIYTSGSTGNPKGVMVSHRNLINLLSSMAKKPGITQEDCFLALTTVAFDISGLEIWLPLLNGAQLILTPKSASINGVELGKLIEDTGTTLLQATPATWQILLDSKWKSTRSLKLLSGGDVLTPQLAALLLSEGHELWNLYGPTETTIWSTATQILPHTVISIGKPIDNTKIYILDKNRQLVPLGVTGELYIGGEGVARGYLNKQELNSEKFIRNPFSADEKSILYKTGDLARYLEDGNIQYLGRIDNQVKINGYRIELGEVEENIEKHENIKSCVVAVKQDKEGRTSLVAYIVLHEKTAEIAHMKEEAASELRTHLRKTLPDYMIPSYFIVLEQLPLNANGKLDRSQLPELETMARDRTHSYIAPKTNAEKIIHDIWSKILSVENMSVHDNFFYLGGDSIIAIRFTSQAKQSGLHFDVKQVFQFPTIYELAKSAEALSRKRKNLDPIPQKTKTLPLVPIQKWFFENVQFIHHFNQSALLELGVKISLRDLKVLSYQLLEKHEALRLTFSKSKEGWIQKIQEIQEIGNIEYCVEKTLKTHNDKSFDDVLQEECNFVQSSLNIETGPLFKLVLINFEGEPRQKLFVVFHHLVIDGISWRIFFDSLKLFLENPLQDISRKDHIPSYASWVWQLNQYANTPEMKSQVEFWHAALSNSLHHSSDRAPSYSKNETTSTFAEQKHYKIKLNSQETDLLLHKIHYAYKTQINDLLLTALAQAFSDISNSYSVSFNIESHGRENIIECQDLFEMLGWFTSTFPITLQLENPNDIGDSIKLVKEKLRSIPCNGMSYGILKYLTKDLGGFHNEIKVWREPKILFNYLGQFNELSNNQDLFKIIDESNTHDIDSRNKVVYDLVINCVVRNQIFEITMSYNSNCYADYTIHNLAQALANRLTAMISHCIDPSNYGYTPSDFPLANLKQEQIDQTLGKLRDIQDVYPLAPMQAAFVFMSFSQKTEEANFIQNLYEINGDLNEDAFKSAWQELFQQYGILRTGFYYDSRLDQPLQYVSSNLSLPWLAHDFSSYSKQDQKLKLSQLMKEDVSRGFKLENPPLVRLQLVNFSNQVRYLIVSYHHIIMDGWCIPIFMSELKKKYSSIIASTTTHESSPPLLSYRNYIEWLTKQDEKKAEAFWHKTLQGFFIPSYLELGNQNSQSLTPHYDELQFYLTPQETDTIVKFAKKCNITLNTLMQVAWGLLLHHYTKKADIMFGVTVSGRAIDLPGIETMLGLCINTVPLRMQISEEEDLQTLLTRTQAHMSFIQEYSYLSLAKIRGLSDLKDSQPLFNTIFVFENYPKPSHSQDSIAISLISAMSKGEYPLGITIVPGDKLLFKFDYCMDNFNHKFVESLANNLKEILLSLADETEEEQNDKQ